MSSTDFKWNVFCLHTDGTLCVTHPQWSCWSYGSLQSSPQNPHWPGVLQWSRDHTPRPPLPRRWQSQSSGNTPPV